VNDIIKTGAQLVVKAMLNSPFKEFIPIGRAKLLLEHSRPDDFLKVEDKIFDLAHEDPELMKKLLAKGARMMNDGTMWLPDPESYKLLSSEEFLNLVTNAGRDQLHLQGYGITGLSTNGFNYIGLAQNSGAASPSASDTSLSTSLGGEITANGFARVQGSYAHTTGTNTTTISTTFTATGSQSIAGAALFNAAGPPIAGTMNNEFSFTSRSLISGDTLATTFTITLG
jgi:hypothetical protein